jgi:CRISPR-associated exonuclease Cas4
MPEPDDESRDPIPISALQHWCYCPRQCGLIHLEQAFEENVHTLRGQAVPYDARLAGEGVHVAVAVRLYQSDAVSLGRGARIAGLSTSEFTGRLGALQIPVIRYSADALERELAAFG